MKTNNSSQKDEDREGLIARVSDLFGEFIKEVAAKVADGQSFREIQDFDFSQFGLTPEEIEEIRDLEYHAQLYVVDYKTDPEYARRRDEALYRDLTDEERKKLEKMKAEESQK